MILICKQAVTVGMMIIIKKDKHTYYTSLTTKKKECGIFKKNKLITLMTDNTLIIKEKIRTYVLQAVYVEKEKIKDDSLIFKEGYFDSMGFMVLITFVEEEFGIKTNDADLMEENFESINAITEYIIRKKQ
jgi:acyl carrier protein